MDENGRPLTAKEKRQEQLKLWETSCTNAESGLILNPKPKVKFNDGAVFLAACSSGDLEELKTLLGNGADINFANIDGLTALHTACIDCKIEVVSFLIDHGANIDQEDNEGWTPLHATASCGFMDIARFLVEKGANVVAVNSEGEVPLDIAEEEDMIEYLQQQIRAQGLDIDKARNEEREMMLFDAQQQLKSVISGEKLTVLVHPNSGASALHVAAAKGYNDVIRLLLKSGMDINMQDNDGWTPLHAAAHWSQQEPAKILSDRGASFTVKNKLGQTAFDVADEEMLEYLDDLKTHQVEVKNEDPIINNRHEDFITNCENDSIKEVNRHRRSSREITSSSDEDDSTSSNELVSSGSTRKQPPEKQGKFENLFGLNQSEVSQIMSKHPENKLKASASVGNVPATRGAKSANRPASLHISSTASTSKDLRPSIQSAQDFTENKSTFANKSNGPPQTPSTPSERNSNIKDAQPNTWRIGLRKTGSFDDKMRAVQRPIGTSNYTSSRTNDSGSPTKTHDSVKTARVAPLPVIDARTNKMKNKEETSSDVFNFQRSGSYRKHAAETAQPTEPSTYKRSTTENKPESTSEPPTSTTTTPKTNLNALINDSPDRRRSFLQPVRDEEAEAQRKARSRRERQSRRSTQGVTLDVFEEAKRQIDTMKTEKAAAAAAANNSENAESHINHNDSSSSLYRRLVDPASSNSTSTPSSLSTKSSMTLPSGYIPSSERVKNTTKTTAVPSISIQDEDIPGSEKSNQDEKTGEDSNSATLVGHSPSVRKTAAQQKRRQRKERRSTGLPGLKPSEANNVDKDGDFDDLDKSKLKTNRNVINKQEDENSQNLDLEWLRHLASVTNKVNQGNLNSIKAVSALKKITVTSTETTDNSRSCTEHYSASQPLDRKAKHISITNDSSVSKQNLDTKQNINKPLEKVIISKRLKSCGVKCRGEDNKNKISGMVKSKVYNPPCRWDVSLKKAFNPKANKSYKSDINAQGDAIATAKLSASQNTKLGKRKKTFKNQSDDELFGAHENRNNDRLREPLSRFESSTKRGFKGSYSDIPDKLNSGKDYKKMYEDKCLEFDRLREELEKEKKERKHLEKELADMEKELMVQTDLRSDNQRLKVENGALIRVLSKLSK